MSLLLPVSAALACPTCSDAIANDPVAAAFSWTTLLMIAMPFSLIGTIGGWVGFTYWRAARAGSVADPEAAPDRPWLQAWAGKEKQT